MEKVAIRGIYKHNSRGRAYFVWYDKLRKRHIIRIQANQNIQNGQTVNIVGHFKQNTIVVHKIIPCVFAKIHRHLDAA